jgi:hypothetical protein
VQYIKELKLEVFLGNVKIKERFVEVEERVPRVPNQL